MTMEKQTNNHNNPDLGYLFLKAIDGGITEQEFEILNSQLTKSKTAREYYLKYIATFSLLQQIDVSYCAGRIKEKNDFTYDEELWDMLSKAEKESPVVHIQKTRDEQHRGLIRPVNREPVVRRINKTSVFSIIISAAAVIFFIIFANLAPVNTGTEVATLTETINAEWDELNGDMKVGARLLSKSNSLWLKTGFAELTFDNDSRVTIEAPAEFEIVADDQLRLQYGRLYAIVPSQALGFTVVTPNSKIIDMGTEFGVRADLSNQTQLHVIKGKTMLISGSNKDARETYNVIQGQAKVIDDNNGVRDIPIETNVFARRIFSESSFVWKGQDRLDLADITGGGDGFGTGRLNAGIDYTGNTRTLNTRTSEKGPADYIPVPSNPFVDGVFIPNGTTQVLSDGGMHTFDSTNGRYWLGILNGAWHQIEVTVNVSRHQLRLNGKTYGTPGNPAIYMSANQGITFDLEAIRQFTNMDITRFTALCGVSESYGDYWNIMKTNSQFKESPKATFQVLVDGQLRVLFEDMTYKDSAVPVTVELSPQDRFLTLVTTQGSDKSNNGDWTLFAEPSLLIRPK